MFCESGKAINTIGQELDLADIFPSCLGGQRQRKGKESHATRMEREGNGDHISLIKKNGRFRSIES